VVWGLTDDVRKGLPCRGETAQGGVGFAELKPRLDLRGVNGNGATEGVNGSLKTVELSQGAPELAL
jgi:hypothetical protein